MLRLNSAALSCPTVVLLKLWPFVSIRKISVNKQNKYDKQNVTRRAWKQRLIYNIILSSTILFTCPANKNARTFCLLQSFVDLTNFSQLQISIVPSRYPEYPAMRTCEQKKNRKPYYYLQYNLYNLRGASDEWESVKRSGFVLCGVSLALLLPP